MTELNELSQEAVIKDASIAGQVGQAGERLVQVQGEGATIVDGQGNTVHQYTITQMAGNQPQARELRLASPYKGLFRFEPEDRAQFFGREAFCDQLLAGLAENSFTLLLGASGSGKSSVVRAGLIPRLQQQRGKHFVGLLLTPDKDPFVSLHSSLLMRGFSQTQAQVAQVIKPDTLVQVVKRLKPAEAYWLIFIDQFEELFTVSEAEKRDCFIHALANLSEAHADDPNLRIVATMRSDFLDQLDPAPVNRIARLTDQHRPLLTQMQPDELRRAIEQPAAQHGVRFEAGLVEEIIAQVQGQAGGLPLLQYTLDLLWESEVSDGGIHDWELNQASYRALGGVQGALRQRVDEIYKSLSPSAQLAAQRIFLRLVEIGGDAAADWRPVRRRAERSAFSGEQEEAVLALLIEARLLVSDAPVEGVGQAGGQGATVEIAHEILLTSWDQLKGWIEQNREDIALRNRLNDDVRQWKTAKPDDELWIGTKLGRVVDLKNNPVFEQVLGGFSSEALAFIEASVRRRDRLEQEKEAQRQRELEYGRKARQAEIEQIRTSVAISKAQLANNQTLDATVESIRAEILLRKSFWLAGEPNSEVKATVLGQLLQMANTGQERNHLEGHQGRVYSAEFSPDGTKLVTAGDDGTARLWSSSGKQLAELKGHQGNISSVVFNPDGTKLATSGSFALNIAITV